ncbi:DNA polymerase III, chi subunit [Meinhardsimonia xiamenensis]|jgi:DNA polymerase-3 subunit chi|uniref:DNA polymerase III, chi subunit n=1 Tax=Meinhardsimonia xiamenensis TaxID=990712 RepID=A0A1G9BG81_9RHOB|nr:DNA polymerase III subunit chi [Meinhardsimonia xiamenensis]PRX34992.1 DNA polymerase III chi subunit [Meinhardsimonia xiamenensis]SDK38501.1 DNA polymerase III, chi subunit [Meinhardsimonia xiamenensis]
MGEAYFYHLTRSPLEAVLPMLLEKALAQGWRVAVRGTDPARMAWLDERLWLGPEEGFLPHGLAGGAHDAAQPVLLTVDAALPNAAACLMAVDGAEVTAEEVKRLERVCVLFDAGEEAALARARAQWRALTAAGCKARYWSEESGRWQMKAES